MKRNKIYVAVTGGIGSGKSTVLNILKQMGYPVFSADEIARNIYDDPEVFLRTEKAFPACVSGGKIDRKRLAEEVFSDAEKLKKLDEITHPLIMQKLFSKMQQCEGAAAFAEVPLLFESGEEKHFDRVIVVLRERDKRIASVMERDGLSEEQVSARIKNQYDYERNPYTGHTVLYNDGDLASLKESVVRIVHEIIGSICS